MEERELSNFNENIRSYATRVRADARQIEYETDHLIFGETSHKQAHIENIRTYLKKIEDHLTDAENLLKISNEITT